MTFELPFHEMCTTKKALLYEIDNSHPDSIDLSEIGLYHCPNSITTDNGKRFTYQGVSDGQAIYQEEQSA